MAKDRLKILVSSTVYGIEELLDRIYTLLTNFEYEVWMSHKGTMPVVSSRSAFENCMAAVDKCDLFIGLITPHYGSGREEKDGLSITHRELRRAIELNKPRWVLAHDHVVFARTFLKHLRNVGGKKICGLNLEKNAVMDDLRVVDMYNEAVRSEIPVDVRQGNWVQKYVNPEDAMLFATAQFSRYQEVEQFIKENFKNAAAISERIHNNGERS